MIVDDIIVIASSLPAKIPPPPPALPFAPNADVRGLASLILPFPALPVRLLEIVEEVIKRGPLLPKWEMPPPSPPPPGLPMVNSSSPAAFPP